MNPPDGLLKTRVRRTLWALVTVALATAFAAALVAVLWDKKVGFWNWRGWGALEAVGTLSASVVALYFGLRSARQERARTATESLRAEKAERALNDAREEAKFEKDFDRARGVAAWSVYIDKELIPHPTGPGLYYKHHLQAIIHNATDLPVYAVTVHIGASIRRKPGEPHVFAMSRGKAIGVLGPGDKRTSKFWLEALECIPGGIQIEFRDSGRMVWRRDQDGELTPDLPMEAPLKGDWDQQRSTSRDDG